MVGPAAPLRRRTGSGLMDEAGAPAASAEGIVAVRRHLGGAGGAVGAVGVSGGAAYAYAHGTVGVSGAADPSESPSRPPSPSPSPGCKHFARRTQTSKIKIDNVYRYVLRLEVEIRGT